MSNKLNKLKRRKKQIEARISSRQARTKIKARKDDTRRKILVGAIFLEKAMREGTMDELIRTIDQFLIRDNDRALFNLPLKQKHTESET